MKNLFTTAFLLTLVSHVATAQWTNGTDITNTNAGNVGIGLGGSAPTSKLDVNGWVRFRRLGSTTSGFAFSNDGLTLRGWSTNNPYIEWVNDNGTRQGYMGWRTDRLSLKLENGFNFAIEGGKVGIGTTTPLTTLQVDGAIYSNATRTDETYSGESGDENANFIGTGGYWALRTGGDNSYNLDVFNSGGGDPKTAMRVAQNGNVGIGTTANTNSFKLAVEGKIGAREVNVTVANPWPDYVFSTNYQLRTIDELESFIVKNNHLPEVPTAADVAANGVDIGAMNAILLKKIEELSLYVIDLKKENDKLKVEVGRIGEKVK